MTTSSKRGPLKIGVVGGGFIGQHAHLDNYSRTENCQIVALAELRPELRKKVCERYGIPRSYATHLELLEDPEVEAVVSVTARPMTGPIALDCLKAGKHLITEKPMASTVEQASLLVETAKETGSRYIVGYNRRHDEGVQKAKQMFDEFVASGELGPVNYVRAHCFQGEAYCNADGHVVTDETVPPDRDLWAIAPDWVSEDLRLDYAWFNNVYCHTINTLRFMMGRTPTVKFSDMKYRNGRVIVTDFGDHLAVIEAGGSTSKFWNETFEIQFEHGRLRLHIPPPLAKNTPAKVELYRGDDEHSFYSPVLGYTWAFRRQAAAFVDCVLNDKESLAQGTEGLEDTKLIEEIWKANLGLT